MPLVELLMKKQREVYGYRSKMGDRDPNGLLYEPGRYMPAGPERDYVIATDKILEVAQEYAAGDESDFEHYYYIETKDEIPHWRKFFDDEDRKWINILEKLPAPSGEIEL